MVLEIIHDKLEFRKMPSHRVPKRLTVESLDLKRGTGV